MSAAFVHLSSETLQGWMSTTATTRDASLQGIQFPLDRRSVGALLRLAHTANGAVSIRHVCTDTAGPRCAVRATTSAEVLQGGAAAADAAGRRCRTQRLTCRRFLVRCRLSD
eukprot:CAMPEP_0206146362 /NCGR_PEP_ID=MMETSP1473-20131121/30119_1 /ASSEMBLY_ACC=CAM_ASM_001109 /TAXON_ID=1461547 /ORGANISM="Stichococcus sp, Strain RCC1054" /LENGTH=111 /DNA_ID=CAMNT_0053542877 /DNA_START=59 /DNA_END=394 /DNA_ORIENTATION=+